MESALESSDRALPDNLYDSDFEDAKSQQSPTEREFPTYESDFEQHQSSDASSDRVLPAYESDFEEKVSNTFSNTSQDYQHDDFDEPDSIYSPYIHRIRRKLNSRETITVLKPRVDPALVEHLVAYVRDHSGQRKTSTAETNSKLKPLISSLPVQWQRLRIQNLMHRMRNECASQSDNEDRIPIESYPADYIGEKLAMVQAKLDIIYLDKVHL
jgi:hypothetical protein